ncbi:MAG: PAS domain S-box protein [Chitinophagaceae bacterium]|nr:PAS domain S-box protein [Chitinophagaceae bacterium]
MSDYSIYRVMIENALDAFFLTKPDGTILDANAAACSMFGYSLEEFKIAGRQGIIDPASPGLTDFLQERKEKGKITCELVGIKNNGEKFPIWVSSVIFKEEGKEEKTFTIIQDITERKRKELELRTSEANMRMILDNTDELFIIIDPNLIIINFNKATAEKSKQLLGVPFEKGKSILDSAQPERIPLLKQLYAEVLGGAVRRSIVEVPPIHNNPKVILDIRYSPIYENGLIVGAIINIRDITEAKFKEVELLRTNERFFYAAKATNDAIWDWDIQNDKVFRVGDGLKNIFGYDKDIAAMDDQFWIKRVHPDDADRMISKRNKILYNSSELYWEDEYRFRKSDGTYAHVFDKGYIIRDVDGAPIRMIGATQDVSERKETEALLVELNNRLKHRAEELANSNIELERFAYVASHDLQEPLRMVTSFLQLLKKRYEEKLDETALQYIAFAVDGAERMKILIKDLLDYSRVGSNTDANENIDLNLLLQEVKNIFSKTLDDVKAHIIVSHLPIVKGNRTQLLQLFQNLISNAIKYHKEGTPTIQINYTEKEEEYLFEIKDNGIGIDPAFHEKIFVIFHRLHSRSEYTGTGIGLAICKKIVERHHGKIWVKSVVGQGSSFFFTLSKR